MENILIYVAGSIAIAILVREGHVWWLNRQERKDFHRMEERYWQEMTEDAVEEAEEFLKEARR